MEESKNSENNLNPLNLIVLVLSVYVLLIIISDKDDNKFLELAEESNADFLITGNTNDFTIKKYKQTRIVTPKEFWENHKPIK